jgi:glutathione S-transferase
MLLEKNLPCDLRTVDLSAKTADFVAASPLGKIPAFVDEDGTTIFDSTVIAEYLEDRYPDPPFYGTGWKERLLSREAEELGDTIADQAVAANQAKGMDFAPGVERAFVVLERALAELERRIASPALWPSRFNIGDAAVISGLGYLELRHGAAPLETHASIRAWLDRHRDRPSVARTVPKL